MPVTLQRGEGMKKIINSTELCEYLGVSRAALERRTKTGVFPKGFKIGTRLAWYEDDIVAFIESKRALVNNDVA